MVRNVSFFCFFFFFFLGGGGFTLLIHFFLKNKKTENTSQVPKKTPNKLKSKNQKKRLRDVAHLMLMKASSPPVRSSNSRVSWVSTSAQMWRMKIYQIARMNELVVLCCQCQRKLISKTPESSSASSFSPYYYLNYNTISLQETEKMAKWNNCPHVFSVTIPQPCWIFWLPIRLSAVFVCFFWFKMIHEKKPRILSIILVG